MCELPKQREATDNKLRRGDGSVHVMGPYLQKCEQNARMNTPTPGCETRAQSVRTPTPPLCSEAKLICAATLSHGHRFLRPSAPQQLLPTATSVKHRRGFFLTFKSAICLCGKVNSPALLPACFVRLLKGAPLLLTRSGTEMRCNPGSTFS